MKLNFGNMSSNEPSNTNFIIPPKQLLLPNTRGEKRESRSGLSEVSHYYGNIAHTGWHGTDAGCHGYVVIVLAKDLHHKQQRGQEENNSSLLNKTSAGCKYTGFIWEGHTAPHTTQCVVQF